MSAPQSETRAKARTYVKRYWLPVVLAALAIIFIVQNTDTAKVRYFGMHFEVQAWLLYSILVLVGIVIGWFLHRRRVKRLTAR